MRLYQVALSTNSRQYRILPILVHGLNPMSMCQQFEELGGSVEGLVLRRQEFIVDVSLRSRDGVFLRLPTKKLLVPTVERCVRRVSGFKKPIDFSSLSREKLTVLGLDLLTSFGVKICVEFVVVFGVCDGADC